ncbi:MAG: hypothetical protein JKY34_05195, partial [Kordiimonadaceae bacterium]|nr:hypothetical protein [Kordiimonadaceae bacterium]
LQQYRKRSGIPELRNAVAHDPEFALAHATLARQLMVHGFPKEALDHLNKAQALKSNITTREASLIDVTNASLRYEPDAKARSLAHMETWPTDVFVFSFLVGPFGQLAFSGSTHWRQENVDLLKRHQPQWPTDDWWFLATSGFMLSEIRDLSAAEKAVTRAFTLKGNGNCAHALSHLHLEQGALDEGKDFLTGWLSGDGKTSDMCHHLNWHRALIGFEKGEMTTEALTALYNTVLDPDVSDPMPLSTFSDNASILWRCLLHDHPMPEKFWQRMWVYAEKHYPHAGFVFADIHKIMLAALSGSTDLYKKLEQEFETLENSTTTRLLSGLNNSFWAYSQGQYSRCADTLKPLVQNSVLLGGSNPQRKIVEETFMAACKRAGKGF